MMMNSNSNGAGTGIGGPVSLQGVGLAPPIGTNIPPILRDTFADVHDLPLELMDTAIFWHGEFLIYFC